MGIFHVTKPNPASPAQRLKDSRESLKATRQKQAESKGGGKGGKGGGKK